MNRNVIRINKENQTKWNSIPNKILALVASAAGNCIPFPE